MRLVVMKLGGSLLLRPDLPDRLRHVLSKLNGDRILVVVGGGTAADVVRDWSVFHRLTDESAHWLAVSSLSLTRALLLSLMPEMSEVATPAEGIDRWQASNAPLLLDVDAFLRHAESADPRPLPHTWDVTSDSIAAWVAARCSAVELLLIKSTELDPNLSVDEARDAGLVDNYFPRICVEVPRISWCNLAADDPERMLWLEEGKPGRSDTCPDAARHADDRTE